MNILEKVGGNPSKLDAVRNGDGIFINTSLFCEEAIAFKKNGYYCPDPWGSPRWMDYWQEQLRRCKEGYEVGGVKITGHHYGYLNFAQIQLLDTSSVREGSKAAKKIVSFPSFWDGDYNYFHCIEIAKSGITKEELEKLQLSVKPKFLNGGKHLLVGKSRRKGYSYKNAWICANNYNTIPNSLSLIGAYDTKFLYGKGKGTMTMASNYLNFFNEYTGWRKSRDYADRQETKRASYRKNVDGVDVESGYLSEIIAISFKDNPDAARGKDPLLVLLEEMGAWIGSKDAYMAIEPGLTAGKYITGQIIGFGTGGDMEGGTAEFAEMFYNPNLYNLLPFENIWDEDSEGTDCSFFHPMQWNREGYYDSNGNSDVLKALKEENEYRNELRSNSSSGSSVLQGRVQEYPICPAEAFLTVSRNNFPVTELRNQLNKVKREKLDIKYGQPVELIKNEAGKVIAKPDLHNVLNPIWGRKAVTNDEKGAVVIYEYPVENAPRGLYKIGYDPVAQDEGTSYNSITVYKGQDKNSYTRNTIVAEYVGRPQTADEANKIFEYLCELYNAEGMYENMVLHVKNYFARRKKLHLLAKQPDQVISKSIKNSGVSRMYGCHMDDKLKDSGEKYIKEWLLQEKGYDEKDNLITNINTIYSQGLLEELIMYHRKGNFDRVMSLMMVMFQVEEEELGKEYNSGNDIDKTNDFLDLIGKLNK